MRELPDMNEANMKANAELLKAEGFVLPLDVIENVKGTIRRAGGELDLLDDAFDGPELILQADCEAWLEQLGFWPRSDEAIAHNKIPPKGWYYHLNECEHNPCLLDLLVMHNDGRYIEVELKAKGGKLSPKQRVLCETCGRPVFWNLETFKEAVNEWLLEGVEQ